MIYSYMKPTSNVVESIEATRSEELVSIVYNEYCNYKEMLESCTDESARPILEAKVEVLYEVSLSDIFEKIKDAIVRIYNAIIECFKKVFGFIKSIFTPETKSNIKKQTKLPPEVKREIEKALRDRGFKNARVVGVVSKEASNPVETLKGIYLSARDNRDLYFQYRMITSTKSFGDFSIEKFSRMNYIFNELKSSPTDAIDMNMFSDFGITSGVLADRTVDNFNSNKSKLKEDIALSVFSDHFVTKYMEESSYNATDAINKYLDDMYNNHRYTDINELDATAYDLCMFGESECEKLEKAAKIIDNLKKDALKTVDEFAKHNKKEYANKINGKDYSDDHKENRINTENKRIDNAVKCWRFALNTMGSMSSYMIALSKQLSTSVRVARNFIETKTKVIDISF